MREPQRLKPESVSAPSGTAEAVPFQYQALQAALKGRSSTGLRLHFIFRFYLSDFAMAEFSGVVLRCNDWTMRLISACVTPAG